MAEAKIHVLDLLPHNGDEDAPIKCETRTVALVDEPEYEALSYVWGDVRSLSVILVEVAGSKVPVTRNLHCALRRLRLSDKTRTLWVDQLCINQDDIKEKTEQVQLMREIYSSCRTCILWQGEVPDELPLEDARAVIELLEYMAAAARARDAGGSIPLHEPLAKDPGFQGPGRAISYLIGEGDDLDEAAKERSWWTRIWTVQEAVLPSSLVLMWGPLSLPWERVQEATNCWTGGAAEDIMCTHIPMMGHFMARIIWLEIAKSRYDSPMRVFFRWRFRRATDPRDKAYALMGLGDRGQLAMVEKCDYDLSPVRVFCLLTTDLILAEEGLGPLVMDPRLDPEAATPGVPRWALDLIGSSPWNTDWHPIYGYDHYIAHSDRTLDLDAFKERMQEEPEVLRIEGARADIVAHVAQPMLRDKTHEPDEGRLIECLNEWREFGNKHTTHRHTYWEAFARTVLGDLIRDGDQDVDRRATTDDLHEVYEYMADGIDSEAEGDVKRTLQYMTSNQTFFVTKTGLLGLGHKDTKPGEEVWVLHGGKMPFTLLPRGEGKTDEYDFGAKCYVQGLMNGELFYWDDEAPEEKMLRIY